MEAFTVLNDDITTESPQTNEAIKLTREAENSSSKCDHFAVCIEIEPGVKVLPLDAQVGEYSIGKAVPVYHVQVRFGLNA